MSDKGVKAVGSATKAPTKDALDVAGSPPHPLTLSPHQSVDLVDLERLIRLRLQPWAASIDYDDLAQECRIAGWRAAARYVGPAGAATIMVKAIDWARASFFRSTQARHGRISRRGVEDPLPVSLDDLDWEADGERAPQEPDFVPALIDRLYAAWVWAGRGAWLPAPEAAVLQALVMGDGTVAQYAADHDRSRSAIFYLRQRALARCRERLTDSGQESVGSGQLRQRLPNGRL